VPHVWAIFDLLADIRRATTIDLAAQDLTASWATSDDLLHGKRIFVPDVGDLRHQVVALAHTIGHEGVLKTLVLLCGDFYMPGDRQLVQDFVCSYGVC
jgi:hypothetical protein